MRGEDHGRSRNLEQGSAAGCGLSPGAAGPARAAGPPRYQGKEAHRGEDGDRRPPVPGFGRAGDAGTPNGPRAGPFRSRGVHAGAIAAARGVRSAVPAVRMPVGVAQHVPQAGPLLVAVGHLGLGRLRTVQVEGRGLRADAGQGVWKVRRGGGDVVAHSGDRP